MPVLTFSSPSLRRAGALLLSATLLSACVHSVDRAPDDGLTLPAAWNTRAPDAITPSGDPRWWTRFQQPGLNALVTDALTQNRQLRAALARIEQTEAVLRQQTALFYPTLELSGGASRGNNVVFIGDQRIQTINNQYSLSASAAYELDLWGRVRHGRQAARLDAEAAALDATAAAHSIAAQVTEAWLSLIETEARLRLTRSQADLNARFLELTRLRFEYGAGSIVGIRQQEQQVAGVRSQAPLLKAQAGVLRNQLAALAGQPPGLLRIQTPSSLPQLPPVPAAGLPADLLLHRPDVMAAWRRVLAADHRVGVAVADRLPSLRLTADAGYQSQSSDRVFDDLIWSVAAGLVGPVFDAGRRAAAVRRADAVLREALAQFEQSLLDAMVEVENALLQEQEQRRHVDALSQRLVASQSLLDATRERYANGLSDYLPVLTALTTLQADEQSFLTAKRQLLSFRVQLHRALGGDWSIVATTPTGEPE
ncbi:efflux transporter outer membrane subunit [Abyssibacter profundi]|uniref:RND transporter n=1 Tax=Abyssibacter profundi TaxID=2182787 RepID=A0A363UQF2_9GAMM|nr:efflux transporter outer membrane subunit [Abyssibacter profundi]PWN57693.1 hypothetical protein DEH80_00700 [Abyssibacter profundi]